MENTKKLKYYIETWGCQMNEEDSEKLAGMLKNIGYESTLIRDEASVIIFSDLLIVIIKSFGYALL